MLKRIISNLNVFLSRCPTSAVANFGGSEVGCSENPGNEEKLKGINNKQIFIRIAHLIYQIKDWGIVFLIATAWWRRSINKPREELNSLCSFYLTHSFGSIREKETSSIIKKKFDAKIAIVHFSIDINRESEAKKESVKRMKMRKTSPPVRWTYERNKRSY